MKHSEETLLFFSGDCFLSSGSMNAQHSKQNKAEKSILN
jgi:hypothetical protein